MQKIDLNSTKLNELKGEYIIEEVNGSLINRFVLPGFVNHVNQIVLVENLDETTGLEIISSFTFMACLDGWYDNIDEMPDDKLPYGSSFLFLDEGSFPYLKFNATTEYWIDEIMVFDCRKFIDQVRDHLGSYKKNVLKIEENGEYIYNNNSLRYDHILPINEKWKNIIPYKNYQVRNFLISESQLHQYFHHLNSSQAMCINFFYPLVFEKKLEYILSNFIIPGKINYKSVRFEMISEVDSGFGRSTNFDFYFQLENGENIYFETKYTESDFGKANFDTEHQIKFEKLYKPLLAKNDVISNKYKDIDLFLENYQIIRNLIHINEKSTVVFIYPDNNFEIRKKIKEICEEIIDEDWLSHFIPITWEELIQGILIFSETPELSEYYEKLFANKYLNFR